MDDKPGLCSLGEKKRQNPGKDPGVPQTKSSNSHPSDPGAGFFSQGPGDISGIGDQGSRVVA